MSENPVQAHGLTGSVCVVVVSWNSHEDLPACVDALRRNTDHPTWRLLVIDNASRDGTREWVASHLAADEFILSDTNLGWVGALNLALKACPEDYLFFLNPDAVVQCGWLEPLVRSLAAFPDAGFASPKFFYPDGTIHYAGASIGANRSIVVRGHGSQDEGRDEEEGWVPFAHGQCLVRRSVVDRVGYLDEGFGLGYFEEIDFQLRAARLGIRCRYVPTSRVIHATGVSFDKQPGGLKEELLVGNWLRLMTIHWPPSWLLLRSLPEMMRPARALLAGRSPRAAMNGWKRWAKSLPEAMLRRRAVQETGSLDWSRLREEGIRVAVE